MIFTVNSHTTYHFSERILGFMTEQDPERFSDYVPTALKSRDNLRGVVFYCTGFTNPKGPGPTKGSSPNSTKGPSPTTMESRSRR